MIVAPDRLRLAIGALERGESVDWRRLALLQALDIAQIGRDFMVEAIQREEFEDDRVSKILDESLQSAERFLQADV